MIKVTQTRIEYYDSSKRLHCDMAPAVFHCDGTKEYYCHGKRHRTVGYAVVKPDGTGEYWLNGVKVTKSEHYVYTQSN